MGGWEKIPKFRERVTAFSQGENEGKKGGMQQAYTML